jgi:indole-3-glycerol phosphate synthase
VSAGATADTPDILKRIVARKTEEVAAAKRARPLPELAVITAEVERPRRFADTMAARIAAGLPAVIAEIKRASPSKGLLREDFQPAEIAVAYAEAGAACLSVLTDRDFFQGDPQHLIDAHAACPLPVIRKDFTIDAYQVYEARALGADCILLIAACLEDAQLRDFTETAQGLGMDVLLEVHDASELERALAVPTPLLGINNRDLRRFEVRLQNTLDLLPRVPPDRLLVTESGIHTRDDVALMRQHGVHGFLVGESFMRAPDPGTKLAELFF